MPTTLPRQTMSTLATLIVAGGLGVSCGSDEEASDPDPASSPSSEETVDHVTEEATADIEIVDFAFAISGPFSAGATVTVNNPDPAEHTVTAANDEFASGTIDAEESVRLTVPDTAGSYDIFCGVHLSMTATIVVES